MHFPGVIYLRDNDTVYIDENAVVFGSIYSMGAKNVRIYGKKCEKNKNNLYIGFEKSEHLCYNRK